MTKKSNKLGYSRIDKVFKEEYQRTGIHPIAQNCADLASKVSMWEEERGNIEGCRIACRISKMIITRFKNFGHKIEEESKRIIGEKK